MPLGAAAQKEHAPERRNCPAETACHGAPGASGGCAFQARSVLAASPERALRGAHGVTFVPPLRGAALPCASADASLLTSAAIDAFFDADASALGEFADALRFWSYDGLTLSLRFSPIPEPSAFGLLAGTLALALAGTRRRRKA